MCLRSVNVALCMIVEGWFNSFIGQQDYKTQWIPLEPVTSGNYVCVLCKTRMHLFQDKNFICMKLIHLYYSADMII